MCEYLFSFIYITAIVKANVSYMRYKTPHAYRPELFIESLISIHIYIDIKDVNICIYIKGFIKSSDR